MAGGVYSRRFLLATSATGVLYKPPAGKIGVVKCIMTINTGSVTLSGSLDIGGTYVWFRSVPGPSTVVDQNLMIVIRDGETLKGATGGTGLNVCVSGYELAAL